MRKIFLLLYVLFSFTANAQLIADPTIEQVTFTDLAGNQIDDTIPIGYIAQLNVPIRNLDAVNGIPAGSCKIKIGLGTKMIVDPLFNVALTTTSEYFDWSSAFIGGQVQITGELRIPLPANYSGIAKFNVTGNVLEYSTITTNFLVTNHNTPVILSDEDPSNNSSFRLYKIVPTLPIPVNISSINAINDNCKIKVSFIAENEINVKSFDIETSKDGISFIKTGTLNAASLVQYSYSFGLSAATASPILYIRIKSTDKDGSFKYSDVKTVNAVCKSNNVVYAVYPNPAVNTNTVTIKIDGALLNGKYAACLYDAKGGLIKVKDFVFYGQQQFSYPVNNIAAGEYILKLITTSNDPVILRFQKN